MAGSPELAEFTAWVEANFNRWKRTAVLMLGDEQKAEDLVQSVLAKVWIRWATVDRDPAGRDAYVRRALTNEHISWWRAAKRWVTEVPTDDVASVERHDLSDSLATGIVNADADKSAIARALRKLRWSHRQIIVLQYYCNMSHAEIGAEMNLSASQVKSRGQRAMEALRRAMESDDGTIR